MYLEWTPFTIAYWVSGLGLILLLTLSYVAAFLSPAGGAQLNVTKNPWFLRVALVTGVVGLIFVVLLGVDLSYYYFFSTEAAPAA